MFRTVIRVNIALREAAARGLPVAKFDKSTAGSTDYMSLAKEIIVDSRKLFLEDFYQEAEYFISEMRSKLKVQTFAFTAPEAKKVYVVGDFNHWKADESSSLEQMPDGRWEKRIALKPGVYKYKFIIDGEWHHDPQNLKTTANDFGGVDSVLTI
jgi:hypothetical protein